MNSPVPNDRAMMKSIRSLENKITYRESYLEQKRAAIHAAFKRRTLVPEGMEIPARKLAMATEQRDNDLEAVDALDASWVEPLRAEYRAVMGLD